MCMLDDGFSLFRMVDIVLEALLKIREVVLHLDIVVVGLQCSLHEPCLASVAGADSNTVRRHDPLQV